MNAVHPAFLAANRYVDADHPAVVAWAHDHGKGSTPIEVAVSLYYAVRDGFRYSAWHVSFRQEDLRASRVLERGPKAGSHCIDKAMLLAAAARVHGIPSRLHFANVRNHVGTARLEEHLGTDLLVFHGYAELFLEGRWVAATPAFNRGLCELLGVDPLEFNGRDDSIFQAHDRTAGKFMEYVQDHGSHAGVPFEAMIAQWKLHYPRILSEGSWPKPTDPTPAERGEA